MARVVANRLLQAVPVLLLVSFLSFLVLQIIPGDPAQVILGENATEEQIEQLREELGLNDPLIVRYLNWLGAAVTGDLGTSPMRNAPVADLVMERMAVSIQLGLITLVIAAVLGTLIGVLSAVFRGKVLDVLMNAFVYIAMATPTFWYATLLVLIFALTLRVFPVQGYVPPTEDFAGWLARITLPVLALVSTPLAAFARQARASVLEVLGHDYVRTARSKGIPERQVITGHALRNGLIPLATTLGLQVRIVVGGSALIEVIFNIPGLGRLMVDSVFNRDFVVIQGGLLVIGTIVVLGNLLIDIAYSYLDPKIRVR